MCAREECIFSLLKWNVLNISVMPMWSNMSFKAFISLLIFCLDDLSISVRGDVKVPYYYCIIVNDFVINWFI